MTDALRGDALHPVVAEVAAREGMPFPLLLALAEAESGRRSDAARWHDAGRTAAAEAAIGSGDMATVERIVREIAAIPSDDLSFGACQPAWRWSQEYAAKWGNDLRGRVDTTGILAFRVAYFVPAFALAQAARTLARLLQRADVQAATDPWERCLFAYNRAAPGVLPTPTAQANYRRALAWARTIRPPAVEGPTMPEHSFQFGFADLADALGADVVGEPVTDEFPVGQGADSGAGATLQLTTKGVMLYASGGPPLFLGGEGA